MNTLTQSRRAVLVALSWAAFINAAQAESPADPPRPFGTDALSVFMAYQNALNAGDAKATTAIWAENSQFAGAMACPLAKPCVGRDAVRVGYIDPAVAMKLKHQVVGTPKLLGPDQLEVRLEVTWPDIGKLDPAVQRLLGTDVVRVQDGRIVSKIYTPDMSDEQTWRFSEALARQREAATSAQQR